MLKIASSRSVSSFFVSCFIVIFSMYIQTMNKVFEHAGDLVNPRVAHNLMRLIAEGFGEDDEGADTQLRSSAVCNPFHLLVPIPS